jgi:uncharacterized protein
MLAARELSAAARRAANTWQNRHITFTHGSGSWPRRSTPPTPRASRSSSPRTSRRAGPRRSSRRGAGHLLRRARRADLLAGAHRAAGARLRGAGTQEQVTSPSTTGTGGVADRQADAPGGLRAAVRRLQPRADQPAATTTRASCPPRGPPRVQQVAPFLELDATPTRWSTTAGSVDRRRYTTSNVLPVLRARDAQTGGTIPTACRSTTCATASRRSWTPTTATWLYRVEDDPVLDAWEQAFPGRCSPGLEEPGGPRASTSATRRTCSGCRPLYTTYHIPEADAFYNRADAWSIPFDPAARPTRPAPTSPPRPADRAVLPADAPAGEAGRGVRPHPAVPRPGARTWSAWLAGRSDGENLGELFAVQFPTTSSCSARAGAGPHRAGRPSPSTSRCATRRLAGDPRQPAGAADRELDPVRPAAVPRTRRRGSRSWREWCW